MDRDYMRRSPSFKASRCRSGSNWQKTLWIAALVIGLAGAGLYLYKSIRAELIPGEGDLIVNINNATQDELETIPGIGPALARQIIAGRTYRRVEDLERVRGISRYTVNSIRPYVKVEGETQKR